MFADLITLIWRPLVALNTIDLDRPISAGLVGLGISVVLPATVSELGALGPFRPPAELGSLPSLTAQGADLYARWSYQHRFLIPLYGAAITLVLWIAAAGLIHLIATALNGRGSFGGFVKLAGYIALLGLLAIPLALIDALLRLPGNARLESSSGELVGVLGLGIFVWQNILLIYAARQHYKISTERAVATVIGPIGGVVALAIVLFLLAVVLFLINPGW